MQSRCQEMATYHARKGMYAELKGMLELAAFHYEQSGYWRSLR